MQIRPAVMLSQPQPRFSRRDEAPTPVILALAEVRSEQRGIIRVDYDPPLGPDNPKPVISIYAYQVSSARAAEQALVEKLRTRGVNPDDFKILAIEDEDSHSGRPIPRVLAEDAPVARSNALGAKEKLVRFLKRKLKEFPALKGAVLSTGIRPFGEHYVPQVYVDSEHPAIKGSGTDRHDIELWLNNKTFNGLPVMVLNSEVDDPQYPILLAYRLKRKKPK